MLLCRNWLRRRLPGQTAPSLHPDRLIVQFHLSITKSIEST